MARSTEDREGGSSSDSEEEEEGVERFASALAENPRDYETHQLYINAVRKSGDLKKLREARETMSSIFPLPGKMWQEWTSDEVRIMQSSQDFSALEGLYERGVKDYLSVPLWVDYLEFVEEHDPAVSKCTPEGLVKMRRLCERAIVAGGLHMTEGSKVWEAYRGFEEAILLMLENAEPEVKDKQADLVRSLFHRQLAVPLSDHASTLEEYKDWEKKQKALDDFTIEGKVLAAYERAAGLCADYKVYEDSIAEDKAADAQLLQNYLLYISAEEATGDPARIQVMFERAIAVFPVTAELWLKYSHYVDQLKVPSVCKDVYSRAVRNCPWLGELWKRYLLTLERFSSADEELATVFENALQQGLQSENDYLDVFLTRADSLRRRVMLSDNKLSQLEPLRDCFRRAVEFFAAYFPDFFDRSLRLHSYWSEIEARVGNDIQAARAVWESLAKSRGWMLEVWQGYISMELSLGNVSEARALHRRCYSKKFEGNGSEQICHAWLRFEREHGSLEDLDKAVLKAGQRLEEVRAMELAQEAKAAVDEAKSEMVTKQATSAKRKKGKESKEPKPKKRQKTEEDKPREADKPVGGDSKQLQEQKQAANRRARNDERTVYVSNLSLEATEEDIRAFFEPCGGLADIRIVRDRRTKQSRGFAYVEFEADENVTAAVGRNKHKLKGRKVHVARSLPQTELKSLKEKKKDGKRVVKPLGWTDRGEAQQEAPKTNSEFRELLLLASRQQQQQTSSSAAGQQQQQQQEAG